MNSNIKDKVGALLVAVLAIILVLIVVTGINFLLNKLSPKQTPQPPKVIVQQTPLAPQPSQYPDYDAIKGSNSDPNIQVVKINSGCPSGGCVNNKPASLDFDGIVHTYKVTGKLARAYLYADLLVDYTRPLTSWDDFYFSMGSYGGHLILDDNLLPVPPSQDSIYLFNLNSVSYYPDLATKNAKTPTPNINIFSILQDGNTFGIHASVLSNRPGRVMKEVSIYYECYQGSVCSIKQIK